MKKIYNKLVRDNIPDIIKNDNEVPYTRILSKSEYKEELNKKLLEECHELIMAKTKEEVIEEAADVFEVLKTLAETENHSIDDVIRTANKKREKKGGFVEKIFLEYTISKENV